MAEVLSAQLPEGQSYFNQPMRRSSPSSSFVVSSSSKYSANRKPGIYQQGRQEASQSSLPSSAPSSPQEPEVDLSNSSSFVSTPGSSFTLETDSEDEQDDELTFPSYGGSNQYPSNDDKPAEPEAGEDACSSDSSLPEPMYMAEDDTAVRLQPSQHVDYLSHDWKEEDIWSSWRHIVSKRNIYGERSRLENASWRTWAKCKYKLKTVSPETLNW